MPTPQMDVLYVTYTGQVLAIFTRTSEPAQIETDPTVFLGDGFHLRGFGRQNTMDDFNNQEFIIPTSQIGLLRTDLIASQVVAPRQYQVKLPVTVPPSILSLSGGYVLGFNPAGAGSGTFSGTPAQGSVTPYLILIYGPTPTSAPASPVQMLLSNAAVTGLVSGKQYFAAAVVTGQGIAVCSFSAP